jgi:NhaP-type Na+/H+ or K+/H+ antiporter
MKISMRDWTFSLLFTSILNTIIANLIGNHMALTDSIPGVLIMSTIAFMGIFIGKFIPVKLPAIVYVVLIGFIIASPISPISKMVIDYTSKISFMAPITVVGTLAGIGLDFKSFKNQSWKMLIIALLVYTGTFVVQAIFAQTFLLMTNAI